MLLIRTVNVVRICFTHYLKLSHGRTHIHKALIFRILKTKGEAIKVMEGILGLLIGVIIGFMQKAVSSEGGIVSIVKLD